MLDYKCNLLQKKSCIILQLFLNNNNVNYIIPGIPPPPIGGAGGVSSLISTNAHSVVKIIPATDAAFSSATLVTFFGSIIPDSNRSTYLSDLAS